MKTSLALMIALLVAAAFVPSPAASDSCNGTDQGFGQIQDQCNFTCNKGNWIQVSGSVDDNGGIEVVAECAGASAKCIGNGSCSGKGWTTAAYSSYGTCKASGYGGAWTTIGYGCATGSGGTSSGGSKLQPGVHYQSPTSGASAGAGTSPGVHVRVVNGVASGFACGPESCVPIVPTCEFHPDLTWTCRAG